MQTNYGVLTKAGAAASLAGAVHIFLIQFDAWQTEAGASPGFLGSVADQALGRVRQELNFYPVVASSPGRYGIGARFRAAWRALIA